MNQVIPVEEGKSEFLRATKLDDFSNPIDPLSGCAAFVSRRFVSEEDSPRDPSFFSLLDIEMVGLAIVELIEGRSNLKELFFSNELLSFLGFMSWIWVGLGDIIFTFDSEWTEFVDLKDIDFPIDLTAPSFRCREAGSLTDLSLRRKT